MSTAAASPTRVRWQAARHPTTLAFVRCCALAGPATAATAVAAGALSLAWPTSTLDTAVAAQNPWLFLPLLVAAACCVTTVVRLWPLFAQQRPGADWLWRWQRGPLRGIGAVVLGALLAQLVLTAPVTTVFARWLGAPAAAHALLQPQLPLRPVLQSPGQSFVATLPTAMAVSELHLRPRAGLPGSPFVPSLVEVRLDGVPLPHAPEFTQDRQLIVRQFPAQNVRSIELRLTAGSVPLWFDHKGIECIAAAPHSGTLNGLFAALLALLPTFLALALAACAGAVATLPTVGLVAGASLFVTTVAGIGPLDATCDALLRGLWLPASAHNAAAMPFLGAACVAMIGRMLLLLPRPRR